VALKQQQQHLPFWVTPDVQARLERQTSGDTQKMETMITKISAWREQTGINTLVAAWSLLSSSKASVSHAHQLHGSSHLPPEASGAQSHAKGAAAGEAHPTPAILTAALRFQLVKQALGYSLVAAQDGFAVLLLKVSQQCCSALCMVVWSLLFPGGRCCFACMWAVFPEALLACNVIRLQMLFLHFENLSVHTCPAPLAGIKLCWGALSTCCNLPTSTGRPATATCSWGQLAQ
jgi:hypothetical protein